MLNPVIVITHVDASGMALRGGGVKSGGRPAPGSGLSRRVTGVGAGTPRARTGGARTSIGGATTGGARTSISGTRTSIGGGGVSTIGKSIGVTARPRSTMAQTPDAPPHGSRAMKPPCGGGLATGVGVDKEGVD
jgi:hypothetical protein